MIIWRLPSSGLALALEVRSNHSFHNFHIIHRSYWYVNGRMTFCTFSKTGLSCSYGNYFHCISTCADNIFSVRCAFHVLNMKLHNWYKSSLHILYSSTNNKKLYQIICTCCQGGWAKNFFTNSRGWVIKYNDFSGLGHSFFKGSHWKTTSPSPPPPLINKERSLSFWFEKRETIFLLRDSDNKLKVPLPRTNYYQRIFSYSDATLWSNHPCQARHVGSRVPREI